LRGWVAPTTIDTTSSESGCAASGSTTRPPRRSSGIHRSQPPHSSEPSSCYGPLVGIGSPAAITIRPPLARRILAAVVLIGIGLIVLIMVEAVLLGGGSIRQPWGSIVLLTVAGLEAFGLWRLVTFSLVLDDREARLNNYFRRQRVAISDIGAIQMVALEAGHDELLPKTERDIIWDKGDIIWDLVWPEQQYGAAVSLRSGAEVLKATATFRGRLNPSVIDALRGWTARYGIPFREDVVDLSLARTSSDASEQYRRRPAKAAPARMNLEGGAGADELAAGLLAALLYLITLIAMAVVGLLPTSSWQFWVFALGWFGSAFLGMIPVRFLRLVGNWTTEHSHLRTAGYGLAVFLAFAFPPAVLLFAYRLVTLLAPVSRPQ
jgi:hypothetical protein